MNVIDWIPALEDARRAASYWHKLGETRTTFTRSGVVGHRVRDPVVGCVKDLGQFLGLLIGRRSLRGGGR
jgi:hypothetical protein